MTIYNDDCGFGWILEEREPDPIEEYESLMDDTSDTWEDAQGIGELRSMAERGENDIYTTLPDDGDFTYAQQDFLFSQRNKRNIRLQ
jgi:hypothetical protein